MKIILAGICKNIERTFPIVKDSFYQLVPYFDSCKGVFYENNSSDSTSKLLNQWKNEDNNIDCLCENISNEEMLQNCKAVTWDNIPCRMELIAQARNKLMTMLEDNKYNDYDYVVLIDMDNRHLLPITNIINVIKKYDNKFDALICNGIERNGLIYDTYAFRSYEYPFGPEFLGQNWWCGNWQMKIKDSVVNLNTITPILSGFNGMAILKKSSINGVRYSGTPTKYMDSIYRKLKNKLQTNNTTHHEGVLLGIYLYGKEGLFYKNNSGYAYPIVCEHIPFFSEMIVNGNSRIFFCPELKWEWSR